MPSPIEGEIFVRGGLLVLGAALTALYNQIRNRTVIFPYTVKTERIGVSATDAIFGETQVLWQGQQLRNLYMTTVEIENATLKDFENLEFKIYPDVGTQLLNQRTIIVDTPYPIFFTKQYADSIQVSAGQTPTQQQFDFWHMQRDFNVPVFNRTQRLQFVFLCNRPNDDQMPNVWVSTQSRGVNLKRIDNLKEILNVPLGIALSRGLIIAAIALVSCGALLKDVWVGVSVSMAIGLVATDLGAISYKVQRWLLRVIGG